MTPGVAETEPHSADIDQRPVSGNVKVVLQKK